MSDSPVIKRRRRWTVDLVVGRRWWLLPALWFVPIVAFQAVLLLASPFAFTGGRWELVPLVVVFAFAGWGWSAGITNAAVLNVRGARLRHRLASIATVVLAGLLSSPPEMLLASLLLFAAHTLFQVTVLRLSGFPAVEDSACHSAGGKGASVLFLLAVTAAAAMIAAAVPYAENAELQFELISSVLLAVTLMLGQIAAAAAYRSLAILAGAVAAAAVVGLAAVGTQGLVWFESRYYAEAPSASAAFAASWTIAFLHRCESKRS